MDGVVVVAERGGALHYARSFSPHFDRLHPRSERMNLGALLFALQSFAADSVLEACDSELPAITLFETATERVVLARSRAKELLVALFVRPGLDTIVAKSLVRRIAYNYDYHQHADSRVSIALNQNARLFREACEKAIRDEVRDRLATHMEHQQHEREGVRRHDGFTLFYYAPCSKSSSSGSIVDEDDTRHDEAATKESQIASPRPTHAQASPSKRLKNIYLPMRPNFSQSSNAFGFSKSKKKNSVMHHSELKSFQSLLVTPTSIASSSHSDDQLVKHLHDPQFGQRLLATILPTMELFSMGVLPGDRPSSSRILQEGAWSKFMLPNPHDTPSTSKVAVDLLFWKRGGSLLIQLDSPDKQNRVTGLRAEVSELLRSLEPLARMALKLAG